MRVDKPVIAAAELRPLLAALERAVAAGIVERRSEENPSLLASFRGRPDGPLSPKWNVKVYAYNAKKGGHSLVCVDAHELQRIVDGDLDGFVAPALPVLRLDDAGWGFPLCGVMVGVTDEREVQTAVVPVEYFRHDTPVAYAKGAYKGAYTERGVALVRAFGGTPATHRIEICTGFLNQPVRAALRELGFDTRVVEIRGLLQDELERRFGAYVQGELGVDLYYDPKELRKSEIPRRYRQCLEFGLRNRPELLKTGWDSLAAYR